MCHSRITAPKLIIPAEEPPEGETLKLIEALRKIPTKEPDPSEPKPAKPPRGFANLD